MYVADNENFDHCISAHERGLKLRWNVLACQQALKTKDRPNPDHADKSLTMILLSELRLCSGGRLTVWTICQIRRLIACLSIVEWRSQQQALLWSGFTLHTGEVSNYIESFGLPALAQQALKTEDRGCCCSFSRGTGFTNQQVNVMIGWSHIFKRRW